MLKGKGDKEKAVGAGQYSMVFTHLSGTLNCECEPCLGESGAHRCPPAPPTGPFVDKDQFLSSHS